MKAVEFITERKKKKKKTKRNSLRRYFFPGYGYYGNAGEANASDTGGGDGGGGESVFESNGVETEVNKFKDWACKKLHIKNSPTIELSYDTEEAQQGHHTGRHIHGSNNIWVYVNNRNLVDILRTVFHELVHIRQGELGMIKSGDSYPGSPIEAMADMLAGKYIKIYGKSNRNIFQ
jgi:hypothetical protein